MAARDVSVSTEDALTMLLALFRDRETADAEAYLELLVEPAQGVPLEPKLL